MYQRSPPSSLRRFFHFAVVSVGVSLSILVVRFWLHALGNTSHEALRVTLLAVIVHVLLLIVALVLFVLGYQMLSAAKDLRWKLAVREWTGWWRRALRANAGPAPRPLPKAGIEAWIRLRELADLEDQDLLELGSDHGVERSLVEALRTKRRASLLGAIEDLARARLDQGVEPLLAAAVTDDQAVQHAALRAAARTLARSFPASREGAVAPFIESLAKARLPTIPTEELILLLGEAAPPVANALLGRQELPPGHLRAALAAARHLNAGVDADAVGILAAHPDPEVRSAALQTLVALGGALSADAADAVRAGLGDERAFLRLHATRASAHLPEAEALDLLWERLGDSSWWVRGAAAETLTALGEAGRTLLERASRTHPDRFARDMAKDHDADLQWKAA